jgi:hypothetical protein
MRKPKWGDRRIMESPEGSEFWIEEYRKFIAFAPLAWFSLPYGEQPKTYATREAAEVAVRGPHVVAAFDAKGEPL